MIIGCFRSFSVAVFIGREMCACRLGELVLPGVAVRLSLSMSGYPEWFETRLQK
ncbi:hypothetical protein OPIT5_24590 [Opitutaceae bacterium TAV5]|nr:hypothetical protein OPIT5_24590 [Opitutaceae bacterium TAV5]